MKNLFDWEVEEKMIVTEDGIALPSKKALFRNDTNTLIEVKNDTYETLFNREIQQVAEAIVKEKGITSARSHTLRGGKSVISQLTLPDNFAVGEDSVAEFLTLINSHDGMSGFLIGFGNMVMSCKNQFHQFKKNAQFKIAHTRSMMARIEMALDGIEKIQVQRKLLNDYLMEFSNVKVDTEEFAKDYIQRYMKFDVEARPEDLKKDFGIGIRTYNSAIALKNDIVSEMDKKGDTMWGAFNGVTYYTNHTQKTKERGTHLVWGTGQRMNQLALEMGIEKLS